MTRTKSTKRALLMSALSLLMCVSMLIGSTFAWFTDSVTSAGNTIQSGTLDVDLVDANGASMEGKVIEFVTADGRAQDEILWEPGCTYETEPVYVVNNGNLAFKYKMGINGIEGDAKLLEAIEWTVTLIDEEGNKTETELSKLQGELLANAKSDAIVLSGHMKEEAGNEYQGLTVEGISITVFATQLTYEEDSFDDQYDAMATVDTVEELTAALAEENVKIVLGSDIELTDSIVIAAGQEVAIDLAGYTLSQSQAQTAAYSMIDNKGTLTFDDSVGTGTVSYADTNPADANYGSNTISNSGTLTINGGKFVNGSVTGVGFPYVVANMSGSSNASLVVNGGTFENEVYCTVRQFCNSTTYTNDVVVNGGDFCGGFEFQNPNAKANNGSLTINGGTISANDYCAALFVFGSNGDASNMSISIAGGTLTNEGTTRKVIALSSGAYIGSDFNEKFVTGGTFAVDPTTYVADGYIAVENADGTYTVIKGVAVSDNEGLTDAISDGGTIVLSTGSYTMPVGSSVNLRGKSITITGTKDTIIDMSSVDARDQFVTGANIVFDGVTLNFGTSNYMGLANTASLTYKNCQINGLQFLYCADVSFENCDFNSNGAEHSVWTYGAQRVSFTGCDFTYGDRGINCYSDNDVTGGKQTVNFTDCTFTTTNAASKGAVEINSCYFSVGIEVNMDGCTAPAYGEMAYVSEWDSTNGANTTINIK